MGFGRESWERLSDERGKRQVGMHFMLSIARRDPRAFVVSNAPETQRPRTT